MKDQIRIAVIDDETSFISGVVPMIRKCFEKQNLYVTIESFTDTDIFLKQQEEFDLLFLDIDMPGMNGIALASELRKHGSSTTLLFVSAHDTFVFESIQYTPFRFIRKRFLQRELPEAISAYCGKLERDRMQITLYFAHDEKADVTITKIAGFYAIRHDLFLLDSCGNSTMLMPRRYTMEQLEEMMQPHGFLRVHKSYLINYRFVYQVRQDRVFLTLESPGQQMTIPMSRRRTLQIREAYHALLGKGAADE